MHPGAETSWSQGLEHVSVASIAVVGRHCRAVTTASPRCNSVWSMPARLSATRLPGPIDRGSPCLRSHADARRPPADVHLLIGSQRAARQRAGDHGAAALRGERAVDPQAGPAAIDGRRRRPRGGRARRAARRARRRSLRRRHDGCTARNVPATRSRMSSVCRCRHSSSTRSTLVRATITRRLHPEQFEDAQVLFALRLPAFGRGDHEQARVDAADSGQHVLQEAHVAGHVDEADRGARRQRRVGEAEVDGQAAALLLGEPVGIGAGERQHQRRLAVVDVAGRGDDASARGRQRPPDGSCSGSTVRRSAIGRCSRTGDDRRVGTRKRRGDRRRCAMPNDGIVAPGAEPAPGTACGARASPDTRRNDLAGALADRRRVAHHRQNGMSVVAVRLRYASAVAAWPPARGRRAAVPGQRMPAHFATRSAGRR